MKKVTDVDIDFADRDLALEHLKYTSASMIKDGELKRHNVGVYLHEVPMDPITGLCSLDYKTAEDYGLFKFDFLNVSVYKDVRDPDHLRALANKEPLWEMLESKELVDCLFHISGHYDVVDAMKPKSVMELAMVLALIRPAKRHLVGKSWAEVEKEVWTAGTGDKYAFKKSHAVAYAKVLVVQMNILEEQSLSLAN